MRVLQHLQQKYIGHRDTGKILILNFKMIIEEIIKNYLVLKTP